MPQQLGLVLLTLGGVFGLLIGSFLNVVVYRVPNGLSVVAPPSACPRCGQRIRGIDNIPVLSWLVLRGKCRDCRTAISARYPIVEAVTGLAFLVVAARFLPSVIGVDSSAVPRVVELVAFLYLMAISVALALIDVDTHRLPDAIVLPAYPVLVVLLGGASALEGDWSALLRAFIGMAGLGMTYLVLAVAVPGGMGFGDVKLAGVLGFALAYLGWGPLAVGAFGAFFLGGIFTIVLLAARRVHRKGGIPFGPWMLAGCWLGVFAGQPLWHGYLSLIGLS